MGCGDLRDFVWGFERWIGVFFGGFGWVSG